jgi:hypothetical protein
VFHDGKPAREVLSTTCTLVQFQGTHRISEYVLQKVKLQLSVRYYSPYFILSIRSLMALTDLHFLLATDAKPARLWILGR